MGLCLHHLGDPSFSVLYDIRHLISVIHLFGRIRSVNGRVHTAQCSLLDIFAAANGLCFLHRGNPRSRTLVAASPLHHTPLG